MDNTGYKIATKIKVTKKSDNSVSEKVYPIGKYKGDKFVSYSSDELAKLTSEEYKKCIQDTKLYILTEEEMEDMGDFLNDNMVQDFDMCPLPLPVNNITVSCGTDSYDNICLTYTALYEVASDIIIETKYERNSSPFYTKLKNGTTSVIHKFDIGYGGLEAMFDCHIVDSTLKEDSKYKYTIQPSITLPKPKIIDCKFNPAFDNRETELLLTYTYPTNRVQESKVVIRISIQDDGSESYFDIVKEPNDKINSWVKVPDKFWGKTANVKIYSVGDIVGENSDSKYNYKVDETVEIPDKKIIQENILSANVIVESGEVYVIIRSRYSVASDLVLVLEDVNPYYIEMKKGENEARVKIRESSYQKTLHGKIYSVNNITWKHYDDTYKYVFGQNITIPKDFLPDNTPEYNYIIRDGSVVCLIDFPHEIEAKIRIDILSTSASLICNPGNNHYEIMMEPRDYGRDSKLMILYVGGCIQAIDGYLKGDKYRYKEYGEIKVVPSL